MEEALQAVEKVSKFANVRDAEAKELEQKVDDQVFAPILFYFEVLCAFETDVFCNLLWIIHSVRRWIWNIKYLCGSLVILVSDWVNVHNTGMYTLIPP